MLGVIFLCYNKYMKIFIGSDHAGFELKEKIKEYLINENWQVEDRGAFVLDNNDDYPNFIKLVAEAVSLDKDSFLPLNSSSLFKLAIPVNV